MRALALVLLLWQAPARACDVALSIERDGKIRARLDREARRSRVWNIAWGIVFTTATAGQLVAIATEFAPLDPYSDDTEAGYAVGAIKSGLGALTRVLLPLRVARPGPPTGDACADLAAAEAAQRRTAKLQRRAFYMNHAGGLVVNLAGLLYLGLVQGSWKQGAISVATGYPIGLLSIYTAPRGAWHAERNVVIAPAVGYRGVSLALSW